MRDDASCYAGNGTVFDPTFPDKIEFLGFGEGKGQNMKDQQKCQTRKYFSLLYVMTAKMLLNT